MKEETMQNEGNEKVVDVRVTSLDGVIQYAPVYGDGSVGQYKNSGHETDAPNMQKVVTELRAQYGLPPVSEGE